MFRLAIPHHNRTGELPTCEYPFIIQQIAIIILTAGIGQLAAKDKPKQPNAHLHRIKSL